MLHDGGGSESQMRPLTLSVDKLLPLFVSAIMDLELITVIMTNPGRSCYRC